MKKSYSDICYDIETMGAILRRTEDLSNQAAALLEMHAQLHKLVAALLEAISKWPEEIEAP